MEYCIGMTGQVLDVARDLGGSVNLIIARRVRLETHLKLSLVGKYLG